MIDSVIFDMDGTILNTLEDLAESVNFALLKFGFQPFTTEQIKYFVGNGVDILFERALPENCDKEIFKKCVDTFKSYYAKNMYNNTKPYDGIIEIMEHLKKSGMKLGVVSNKFEKAVKDLSEKYFNGLIDAAIGQNKNIPPKPDPLGLLECVKKLNSKNAIFVGDSDVDIQTAKNANIIVIGVTWGLRSKEYLDGANYIVSNPKELSDVIFRYNVNNCKNS